MKDITSPQSYIDMGFYYMISVALQRRVWLGSYERPLFPNMYIILVGEPGLGKGLVLRPIGDILKSFPQQATNLDESQLENEEAANEDLVKKRGYLLFPCAADTTTFESLIRENANSIRTTKCEKNQMAPRGVYSHSSMFFLLEEMGTLFRKQSENLINYLLVAYDCGDPRYKTKHNGEDTVKKCCLSILGGTTPSFMHDSLSDKIIGEGFSSRTIFVYASKDRMAKFDISKLTQDQIESKEVIRKHLLRLSKLFGEVQYAPDAYEYLKNYFELIWPQVRPVGNYTMTPYYARKKVHVLKLALAVHFAESESMTLELKDVQKAMAILEQLEKLMPYALSLKRRNPLDKVSVMILEYIGLHGSSGLTFQQIWERFNAEGAEEEIKECLRFLMATNKLEFDRTSYKYTKKK